VTIPSDLFEYVTLFTWTYREADPSDIAGRELACLRVQYPFILQAVEDDDLIAGRIQHAPIGFSPQMGSGFGYYLMEEPFRQMIENASPNRRRELESLFSFWTIEQTSAKTRRAYPPSMAQLLPSDRWNSESGIAFPLYRMAGSNLNYEKLIQLGISGLKEELAQHEPSASDSGKKLYRSLDQALDLLSGICFWYAVKVEQKQPSSTEQRDHFQALAAALRHIAVRPPETFQQALQLFWLYALVSGNVDYGRFDITFTSVFKQDREKNGLSDQQAVDLLTSLWRLINEREGGIWIFDSRVIIGGRGRGDEVTADDLALLCIQATRRTHQIMPQLSLRFYQGQNPLLYRQALDCISDNNPYPMLYNDDVNIPAVAAAFDIAVEEAVSYAPFGCGEYILEHKSFGTPSGVINLLQALLVTLNGGVDPTRNIPMGTAPKTAPQFHSFDDLLQAYEQEVEAHVRLLAKQQELEYRIAAETAPFLFFTLLYDDCLERGRALFDGGIRYLGGTLETYGNTNTADSLFAIKKWVFEHKRFTLDELRTMLKVNFVGYERERRALQKTDKFGNDLDEVDELLLTVDHHVFKITREQIRCTELSSYLVVVINNNANTVMGRYTAASPDGRRAFTPMNNGNGPSSGMDKNGLTAMLNSIVKPSPRLHAGAVQNIKLSQELFRNHRRQVEQALEVYWERGGAQAMLTVIGRDDLENALLHPEHYQNLYVRVGGYSARFIDLAPDIQAEIMARTLY